MMSLTFGLFTQVSGSGPLGPLVITCRHMETLKEKKICFCRSQFFSFMKGIVFHGNKQEVSIILLLKTWQKNEVYQ